MVACIIAVAVAAHGASTLPLLVISANEHLGQAFQRGGMPLTAQLSPDADDARWRYALARLVKHDRDVDSAQNGHLARRAADLKHPPAAVRLRRDLWLDLDGCVLYPDGNDRGIPLTGREVTLITAQLAAPRRYLRTRELALRLARSGIVELDEHCIEQTVSGLRRKLGESARRARLLRTRYGVGYGLFLEDS